MFVLGQCSVCGGEYCARGEEVVCLSCGRPKVSKPEPLKHDEEARKAWMVEQARAKAKRQRVEAAQRHAEAQKAKAARVAAKAAASEPVVSVAAPVADEAAAGEPAAPKRKR